MSLPAFLDSGNLPPGVHRAGLTEVLHRFGRGSARRQVISRRLQRIYSLVEATQHLARFVVFGSFVTAKSDPNDLDIVLIMEDAFDVATLSGDARLAFQHRLADSRLGASIFWTTRSGALGGEEAMIKHWQICRDGGLRGIVEIVREEP